MTNQSIDVQGNANEINQVIKNVFDNPINMDFFALEKTLNQMIAFLKEKQWEDPSEELIKFFNTTRESIELKNKINSLPQEYFESIKAYIPDFQNWRRAIWAAENEDCQRKYTLLVRTLKPIISTQNSFADAIQSLFNNLNKYLINREDKISEECREKMLLVLYFMYYFCDIGKDPHANTNSN